MDLIFQPDSDEVAVGIPLAGSIIGLAAAATATRDTPGEERVEGRRIGRVSGSNPRNSWNGPEAGSTGSLFGLSRGRLTLDTPRPFPTLVPVDAPNGFRLEPALALKLFSARF
ncbi:MAG: hypothetical protein ACQET1_09820 [Gemmatimonadota bacterium]